MGFRHRSNHSAWLTYCEKNQDLIEALGFHSIVFENEKNFREFVTYGKVKESEPAYSFSALNDDLYGRLFEFIANYFDMDMSYFERFKEKNQ